MSVPKGLRKESRLAVQTKALELAKHTTTICNNSNIFPKRDRWLLANRIVGLAIDIVECVYGANDIQVTSKEAYQARRALQLTAYRSTARLLALAELAYAKYSFPEGKLVYWLALITEERGLLAGWLKSDKDRYKYLLV